MTVPLVLSRDEGPVRWLTLNDPDRRNALGAPLIAALRSELDAAAQSGVRCVAITGAGKVFSAGADLRGLQEMAARPREENVADARQLADLLLAIALHPLPVIAAVNGHALGGGAGLALACDLTIAVEGSAIGFTEVRVGFVPALILNFLLRTAGEKVLRDLCLTGRRLSVEEASTLGFVNVVVPAGALEPAVAEYGGEFVQASPQAVARTKRLFVELRPLPLAEGLNAAAEANADARVTDDCREGVSAFLEKRDPRWTRQGQ